MSDFDKQICALAARVNELVDALAREKEKRLKAYEEMKRVIAEISNDLWRLAEKTEAELADIKERYDCLDANYRAMMASLDTLRVELAEVAKQIGELNLIIADPYNKVDGNCSCLTTNDPPCWWCSARHHEGDKP